MATKHRPEHHSEPRLESPMDYAQHEGTYEGFITGVKWVAIISVISMVILYFLIQP
ncbi:aa3-type cytochrome c oxidase subunit IV [Devosia alba]|uniref:aa3-type cytochrome c oxidase subunit IV n=1 Tax=Devosia alba TaxID=3152360 RepID=UPI003262E021